MIAQRATIRKNRERGTMLVHKNLCYWAAATVDELVQEAIGGNDSTTLVEVAVALFIVNAGTKFSLLQYLNAYLCKVLQNIKRLEESWECHRIK